MVLKIASSLILCFALTSGIPLPDILSDDGVERTEMNIEETGTYFEGDIILPNGRNGLIDANTHWDNGIVPYEIIGSFSTQELQMISDAMDAYHQYTCVRFVPHIPADESYISITNERSGCWSSVGKIGGQQKVNLDSNGCLSLIGTVIHELMHAVGFTHEQNRSDRDKNVEIRWQNIAEGRANNFNKANNQTVYDYGVPYDFNSVLHYSSHAFSTNGRPTIVALTKNKVNMGQRKFFSPGDIKKIRRMYQCKDRSAAMTD